MELSVDHVGTTPAPSLPTRTTLYRWNIKHTIAVAIDRRLEITAGSQENAGPMAFVELI
jgi:hypothetical protein